MTTAEALALLEDLDKEGDVYMGFPENHELSDGDSDLSDDEATASSNKLGGNLLSSSAELRYERESSDEEEEIAEERPSKKRKTNRKWTKDLPKNITNFECTKPISDQAKEAKTPTDYFELFLTSDLLDLIVEQSNNYALQKNRTLNVTRNEIKLFLGGLFLSSISPLPNKKKYWSSGDHIPKILSNSIRRDRYLDILHNLHLVDNSVSSSDRSYKLRPLFESLQNSFKEHGGLEEHLSIDESMIPYFGKHFAKQFIRGKPIRFGFKMWALCCKGGYLVSFDLYMGKNESGPNTYDSTLGLGGSVVMRLLDKAILPADKGHKVYFDNYFSSVALMDTLKNKKILASGTCRENRTEKCPIIVNKNAFKTKPRGTFDFRVSDDIVVVKWKDNKDVVMVTNFDSLSEKSTKRWDKKEKKYINVPQPACVQNYNKYMGFVDQMDQNVGTYRIRMRQRKWWWPIFSYMMSVAANNACQLMKKNGHPITLYQFLEHLVIFYCKSYGTPRVQGSRSLTSRLTDIARYDGLNHWIVKLDKQKTCRACKTKTSYRCEKCDVGLHTNCFKDYHTKQE